jgi:hypothetical protein
MRDKIAIKGKYAIKTTKRSPVQKKRKRKRKRKMRDNRENLARDRSVEFRGANNALVAISLASTVGSC